jgi:hypothetical protein
VAEHRLGRGSRVAVRVLALLGLVSFSFMLVFVVADAASRISEEQSLEPPGSAEARIGAEHPGETVHIAGAVTALTIGVSGLVGLIIAPTRAGSATQTGAAVIAMLLTTVITGNPDNRGGQAGIIDPAFLILALPPLGAVVIARPWRAWRAAGKRPRYFFLAALALPGAWYGIQQALMQRNTWPPMADPHHQAHWLATAIAAFAILFAVTGAGLPGRGWRVAGVTSGLGAVALAGASLVDRTAASALAPVWAIVAFVWGVAVAAVTYKEMRTH